MSDVSRAISSVVGHYHPELFQYTSADQQLLEALLIGTPADILADSISHLRVSDYGETSATLNKKMAQAYANGLTPIYCVGENLEEREAGKHFDVVKAQIEEVVYNLTEEEYKNLVIAYEPVWAIGTGKTASAEQAQEIHAYIRQVLAAKFGAAAQDTAILYGGSCKPSNAPELFAKEDVDGGLIGGAALKAEDFLGIGKGFAK